MSGGRPRSRGRRRHTPSGDGDWDLGEAIGGGGYNSDGGGGGGDGTTITSRPTHSSGRTSRPTSRSRGSGRRAREAPVAPSSSTARRRRSIDRRITRSRSRRRRRDRDHAHDESTYTTYEDDTVHSLTVDEDEDEDEDDSDETPLTTQRNISPSRPSHMHEKHADDDSCRSADDTTAYTHEADTTDDCTEDARPRRKRSGGGSNYRSRAGTSRGRGRTANPGATTATTTATAGHHRHRHRHRHGRSHHSNRNRNTGPGRRGGGGNHHRPPDPLITPEMLSSLSTSVSTSLRTGICRSYELFQQGSAAATAATHTLQTSLHEAGQSLPSGDDVAGNVVGVLDKAEGGLSHMLRMGSPSTSRDQDLDIDRDHGEQTKEKETHVYEHDDSPGGGKDRVEAYVDRAIAAGSERCNGHGSYRSDNALLRACLQPEPQPQERPKQQILLRHSPAKTMNSRYGADGEGNDGGFGNASGAHVGATGRNDSYISETTAESSMQVGDVEVVLPPSPDRPRGLYPAAEGVSLGRGGSQLHDESMFGGTTYSSINPASLLGEGIADDSVLNTSSYSGGGSRGDSGGGCRGDNSRLAMQSTFGGTKGGYPVQPSLVQQKKKREAATAPNFDIDEYAYDTDEGTRENVVSTDATEDAGSDADSSAATDEGGGGVENIEDAQTPAEQLRTIQSLRLQIEALQQTTTLAQRGWDDARTTLDKERAEALRLQTKLQDLRDENARLRERNSELEKSKEENGRIVQKMNDDNETLAKELIESISQQDDLKHAASVAAKKKTMATDASSKQNDGSVPSTPTYSLPSDEGKGTQTKTNVATSPAPAPAPAPPAPAPLPPLSPGRSFSSASTPTESSEQAKARIRAERKARILNRPKSRGRAGTKAGTLNSGTGTPAPSPSPVETLVPDHRPPGKPDERSKLPLRVEKAVVDWTNKEKSSTSRNNPEDEVDWADPDLDPSLFELESSMADHLDPPSSRRRDQTPSRRKMGEKEPMLTPATVAATPSPENNRRGLLPVEGQQIEESGGQTPWSSIRSAPLHIVQPPRLFPSDLAKSNNSHAVMTYVGPRSTEPDGDLAAAEFDAAYLTLDDANFRARYAFFVLNAMGKEVEELIDDPGVVVSATDDKSGDSSAWGERLQLSYKYKDWMGQQMIWKVWVIPAGGFASSSPRNGIESVDSTTKKSTTGGKLRMLV